MKARAHIYISGRVQGVCYRAFTEELAESLGLTGWVRNLPDRRVEAVFEGERAVIEEAISRCRSGPPASHVTGIEAAWGEKLEGFKDFSVRY